MTYEPHICEPCRSDHCECCDGVARLRIAGEEIKPAKCQCGHSRLRVAKKQKDKEVA